MPTPDELRASLAEARAALRDAITAASGAWEREPGDTGLKRDGSEEAAWTARKVAEHAIPSESFFTTAICAACGYPGVDAVTGDYATSADAIVQLDTVIEMCNKKLKYVSATDIEIQNEEWKTNVAGMLQFNAQHLTEHAAQIRAAAGV